MENNNAINNSEIVNNLTDSILNILKDMSEKPSKRIMDMAAGIMRVVDILHANKIITENDMKKINSLYREILK